MCVRTAMRKWTVASVLLLLCLLFLFADQGTTLHHSPFTLVFFVYHFVFEFVYASYFASVGRKFQANAAGDSDELVDPPKVEDKIGAVPQGLSTDSDVVKRYALFSISLFGFRFFVLASERVLL